MVYIYQASFPKPGMEYVLQQDLGKTNNLQLLFLFVCVLVFQSCLTPCNPMDCSPPGSSVHGILQVRILEWVAIFYSRVSSQPRDQISCIGKWCLFVCFFFLFDTTEPPGKHFYLAGLGKGLSRCMSNKILGNTDTVSLEFSP